MGLMEEAHSPSFEPITFGSKAIDEGLNGGLRRGALHEIFAARHADSAAAIGFACTLALRAAGSAPILLARQDVVNSEMGHLNASGLCELGLDPSRIILVQARDIEGVLRAGEQGARCPPLGAVLMQSWGNPKILDLKASRRLALASAKSGVPVFMVRVAAAPEPSAAVTRWIIETAPSRALAANAPGAPAFVLNLARHRGGVAERRWHVEWNRDRKCFEGQERAGIAPLPRPVVSVPVGRSAALQHTQRQLRAG